MKIKMFRREILRLQNIRRMLEDLQRQIRQLQESQSQITAAGNSAAGQSQIAAVGPGGDNDGGGDRSNRSQRHSSDRLYQVSRDWGSSIPQYWCNVYRVSQKL